MRGWSPLTWVVLAAGLLALPYLWLTREEEGGPARRAEPPPATAAITRPDTPASAPAEADPVEAAGEYAAIVERPLFLPGRRPIAPPAEPEPAPAAEEPEPDVAFEPPLVEPSAPPFRLVGTLVGARGDALAIVESAATGTRTTLTLGDALDGWQLDSVGNGTIEVRQADRIVRIALGEAP